MSVQALSWVLDHSETRGAARLALIAIANHADRETGECFPSQRTIAREARLSPGAIPAAVRDAVELGELEVVEQGGPRRQSTYRMTFSTDLGITQTEKVQRSPSERSQRSPSERSAHGGERSAQSNGLRPAETSLTINEPSMNRGKGASRSEKERIAEALAVRPVIESPDVELHHPDPDEVERVRAGPLAAARARVGLDPTPTKGTPDGDPV